MKYEMANTPAKSAPWGAGTVAQSAPAEAKRSRRKKDGATTRRRILQAAICEFAEHGYSGARINRIIKAADINVRMLYHYYGNKEELYLCVLEEAYRTIRESERTLALHQYHPVRGVQRLVELTFDFLRGDPNFVRLVMTENLMKGAAIRKSKAIPEMTLPLVHSLRALVRRGQEMGLFHNRINSEDLYMSILGLCIIHISNKYTLSSMFQMDVADPKLLRQRRANVSDMVITYLTAIDEKATSFNFNRSCDAD